MNGGEVVPLPSEIWLEIFRQTPAADLLRLKAVCKSFYALISDDFFVQQHLKHLITCKHPKATKHILISTDPLVTYQKYYDPDKRTISVCRYDEEPSRFDVRSAFNDPVLGHGHRVIDSYHGILLVQIRDVLCLCNPITRSYKFLPSTSINCGPLNFNCLKLGYDDVSEQYKVFELRLWMNRVSLYVFDVHSDRDKYQLHSPRGTTAMKEDDSSHIIAVNVIKESVLLNGNVYWLVIAREYVEACIVIISANLTTEEVKTRICSSTPFTIVDIDNVFAANGTFYQFGRSYHPATNYELQLWVLEGVDIENPNPSWTMKHRIDTHYCSRNSTIRNYPYFMTCVLGMFRDKILIMMITAGKDPQQLLYQYDLSREEFEQVTVVMDNLNIGKETMRRSRSFRIIEHVDSLISL